MLFLSDQDRGLLNPPQSPFSKGGGEVWNSLSKGGNYNVKIFRTPVRIPTGFSLKVLLDPSASKPTPPYHIDIQSSVSKSDPDGMYVAWYSS